MTHHFHILILNGPNLNLLGIREPEKYGCQPLLTIIEDLKREAKDAHIKLSHLQSNAEHEILERIHEARGTVDFIIINPAAFTHTSIALRDALLAVQIPFFEVHLSNIYTRETFRHCSYLSDIAAGIICGLGTDAYMWALKTAIKRLLHIN